MSNDIHKGLRRFDRTEHESVETEDQTINNSVTYPDGTTITTSPGGGGATEVFASSFGSDETAIQSALNDRGTNPSTVHVDVSTTVTSALTIPSNTLVLIEGDLTLGADQSNNIFENENFGDETVFDANIHIRGDGGSVDGNRTNQSTSATNGQHPIYLNAVEWCSVRDVFVKSSNRVGIGVRGVRRCIVKNNRIEDTDARAVSCTPSKLNNTQISEHVVIHSNFATDCGGGANTPALGVQAFRNAVVSNNIVQNGGGGIVADPEDAGVPSNNVAITGNVIRGVNGKGIMARTKADAVLENVTISDNTVDNTGATQTQPYGIVIFASDINSNTKDVRNVAVSNNVVHSEHHGIICRSTDPPNVIDFTISDNYVTAVFDGVIVSKSNDGSVVDNVLRNCRNGVAITDCNNVLVSSNAVDNASSDGINNTGGSSNCAINGNVVRNSDTAINEEEDSGGTTPSGSVILLNDCRGNTTTTSLSGSGTITDPVGGGTAEDWNVT